jgi:LAS superfamily LD-carboxypeptidase LdcB
MAAIDPILLGATAEIEKFLRSSSSGRLGIAIIEGVRSPERQRMLFEQGRSLPGSKVTQTLKSKHLTGRAIDVTLTIDSKRISQDAIPREWWDWIAQAYSVLTSGRIRSGSSWGDFTHIELL